MRASLRGALMGLAGLLLVAYWVMSASGCASSGIALFDLEPSKGGRASFEQEGITLEAVYMDVGERTQYLVDRGREQLAIGLRPVNLATFVIMVRNGSGREVVVDPSGIRLVVGFGPTLSPLSYAHIYMELAQGAGRQRVLQELQGVVLERPVTVMPGDTMEQILLFSRPEQVAEEVVVLFSGLYVAGRSLEAVLSFRAVSLED
ncbi:MAG: hypothetical protein JSV00_10210 [bacterium]|nr:MAG: hypothetical protein JSV00_10210 [bacterium]